MKETYQRAATDTVRVHVSQPYLNEYLVQVSQMDKYGKEIPVTRRTVAHFDNVTEAERAARTVAIALDTVDRYGMMKGDAE